MEALTDVEVRMLAFEHQRWQRFGAKESAVRDTFGLSMPRYLQALNGLINRPAALVADPVLVRRLQRLRATRRARRAR